MKRFAWAGAFALMSCNGFGCPSLLAPWIDQPKMLPRVDPIPALASISAERCGQCHRAIYEEWKTSLMGQAEANVFFRAERAEEKNLFLCERCHNPLENQQPLIVTGLQKLEPLTPEAHPNPIFDAALRHEGVTCAVCHMSAELAHWPSKPPEHAPAIWNARALPDAAAPHPIAVGPALADPGGLCLRCHQFDPIGSSTKRPPLDTMKEHAIYRAHGGTETCISCHMPAIERRSVESGPVRTGHDHRFLGVRDAAFVRRWLSAGVSIRDGAAIVELENRSGHRFPTGDPSRVLRLDVRLIGPAGQIVAARRIRVLREMDTLHLIDHFDTTLEPGEHRTIRVDFDASEVALAASLVLSVELMRYEEDHPIVEGLASGGPHSVGALGLTTHVLTATVGLAGAR